MEACVWGIFITTSNAVYQIVNAISPTTPEQRHLAIIYMVGSGLSYLSFALYYYKKVDTIYIAVIYYNIRNALTMLDLEKQRAKIPVEEWQMTCIVQIIGCLFNVSALIRSFPSSILHLVVVRSMFIYFAFAILCGVVGMENLFSDYSFVGKVYFYKVLFAMFILFIYDK